MNSACLKLAVVAAALPTVAWAATAEGVYDGDITLNKDDGIYEVGETATCKVMLTKDQQPLKGVRARMILKVERKIVKTQDFETTGEPVEFSYTGTKPEWAYFGFEVLDEKGKALKVKTAKRRPRKPTIAAEVGVMFSPDKIVSPTPEPADFEKTIANLKKRVLDADKNIKAGK